MQSHVDQAPFEFWFIMVKEKGTIQTFSHNPGVIILPLMGNPANSPYMYIVWSPKTGNLMIMGGRAAIHHLLFMIVYRWRGKTMRNKNKTNNICRRYMKWRTTVDWRNPAPLGMYNGKKLPINWCRISSINSISPINAIKANPWDICWRGVHMENH